MLNSKIKVEEVQEVLDKAKPNKAVGTEDLFNEVLENPISCNVLHCLCHICFHNGIIPSVWNKSIVKPIPKSTEADPRVLLSSVVRARLEEGKSTFVCFVDFKKAFDCVN